MSKSAIDIRGTRTERKSTLAATVVVADLGLAKALLEPPTVTAMRKGIASMQKNPKLTLDIRGLWSQGRAKT